MVSLADWFKQVTSDPDALAIVRDSEDRIRRAYTELLAGYQMDAKVLNVTVREELGTSGPVTVDAIPFFSVCGHHLLPYYGTADVTYWPGEIITGLGKIPRLVDILARRLSIQEHLTRNIAESISGQISPRAVKVRTSAVHMCMVSRGPNAGQSRTTCEYECGDRSLLGAGRGCVSRQG